MNNYIVKQPSTYAKMDLAALRAELELIRKGGAPSDQQTVAMFQIRNEIRKQEAKELKDSESSKKTAEIERVSTIDRLSRDVLNENPTPKARALRDALKAYFQFGPAV